MEYQRDEHRVHLIVYHLIWCPKRRKPVLTGKVAAGKLPSLWTRSYFASTAGNVSQETIRRCIDAQKGP
jgi:REP element-mobilizing transposase RayT